MSIQLIPNEIVKTTNGRFISGIGLTMIDGVYVDDRKVTPGSLFVPLKGSRHGSIEKAFQKGAVATLVNRDSKTSSRAYKNNPKKIFIEVEDMLSALVEMGRFWRFKMGTAFTAITGSKNSSRIKDLCFTVINNSIKTADIPHKLTDSLDLSLLLMDLKAEFKKGVVGIETENPDETEKLIYISEPSVIMITDTVKKDIKLLSRIIENLEMEKTLILNADDPGFASLKKCAQCNVVTFGTKKADICAAKVKKQKDNKTDFVLNVLNEKIEITAPITKDISLSDYLAAAAAAHVAGLGIDEIKKGLEGIN
jgi:UDP-N-acetylmuramoyl-tripeptide--D-alanyl-D-alanine ligase